MSRQGRAAATKLPRLSYIVNNGDIIQASPHGEGNDRCLLRESHFVNHFDAASEQEFLQASHARHGEKSVGAYRYPFYPQHIVLSR